MTSRECRTLALRRHIRRLFLHAQIGTKAIFTSELQPWISISHHPVFTASRVRMTNLARWTFNVKQVLFWRWLARRIRALRMQWASFLNTDSILTDVYVTSSHLSRQEPHMATYKVMAIAIIFYKIYITLPPWGFFRTGQSWLHFVLSNEAFWTIQGNIIAKHLKVVNILDVWCIRVCSSTHTNCLTNKLWRVFCDYTVSAPAFVCSCWPMCNVMWYWTTVYEASLWSSWYTTWIRICLSVQFFYKPIYIYIYML